MQKALPVVVPQTFQEEIKYVTNDGEDDEETGLEISHIIGNKSAVDAAKIALKNSAKTLIKIEGSPIDFTL